MPKTDINNATLKQYRVRYMDKNGKIHTTEDVQSISKQYIIDFFCESMNDYTLKILGIELLK